jgi:hypothetical protein
VTSLEISASHSCVAEDSGFLERDDAIILIFIKIMFEASAISYTNNVGVMVCIYMKCISHRKFEVGGEVLDVFTSVIHTCDFSLICVSLLL